jgi:hypothetical protein
MWCSLQVMVEVRRHEMLIAGETLPLPIASNVEMVDSEVTAIDLHAGTIRTVAKLLSDSSIDNGGGQFAQHASGDCVTREELWYAHRLYEGLIVRDIQFTNTLHQPVVIQMALHTLTVSDDTVIFGWCSRCKRWTANYHTTAFQKKSRRL